MHNKEYSTTFFICLAIVEIIIAIIASTGLGINLLATTSGEADIKLTNTSIIIGEYYADLELTIDAYEFTGYMDGSNTTDYRTYTYKESYEEACGRGTVMRSDSNDCKMRYAVWQWTRAFIALGAGACCLVFLSGIVLLFLACCRKALVLFCCGDEKDAGCCHCLFSCTVELWFMLLNFFIFLLFAFSWAIIIGLKFDNNLENVIAESANEALNEDQDIQYYDFTFESLQIGDTLWTLMAASFLSLLVSIYLMLMLCYSCCCATQEPHTTTENNKQNNAACDVEV
jgi:hypothetical protein